MLTAALDAARLGARAPLSADFLRAAAPGYCTSQQQAEAPDNWFEQALAYATAKLHGAAAALSPAGAGMGQVAGYTVADYLIQHASRERRYARVPASTWDAILSHIRDPADAAAAGQTYLNVGWAAYGRQQWQAADDAFPEGNGQRRCSGGDGLAVRLGHTGQTQQAADVLRTALSLAPADTDAAGLLEIRAELAWWTGAAGNVQGGIRNSQRCLARHPQNLRRGARIQPSRWTGSGPLDWALGEHGRGSADRPPGPGGLHAEPLAETNEVTLTSRFEVAAWSWEDGHRDQAMRLWQDLDADTTRVLGEFNHLTNDTRWNLAAITIASGDIQDGLRLMDSVVAGRIAIYGDDHPGLSRPASNSRARLARPVKYPTPSIWRRKSPTTAHDSSEPTTSSPSSVTTRSLCARPLLGDTDQAKALFSTLLTGSDRILGPDHELTRDIRGHSTSARPDHPLPPPCLLVGGMAASSRTTAAMASVVILVPRLEMNRAAESAPGLTGRPAASASRNFGCAGTVRDSSLLPTR